MKAPAHPLYARIAALNEMERKRLSGACGVPYAVVNNAAHQIPINAEAFLALCYGVGIEPVDGAARPPRCRPIQISWRTVAISFAYRRAERDLNIRQAAKAAGLSFATMSRAENGHVLSASLLIKLCRWLEVSPETFIKTRPASVPPYVGRLNAGKPDVSRITTETRWNHSGRSAA